MELLSKEAFRLVFMRAKSVPALDKTVIRYMNDLNREYDPLISLGANMLRFEVGTPCHNLLSAAYDRYKELKADAPKAKSLRSEMNSIRRSVQVILPTSSIQTRNYRARAV